MIVKAARIWCDASGLFLPWGSANLDDSGVMRRVDPGVIIGRIDRDRVAAIRAAAHSDINGHAACRAADMAAIVAIHRYRTGPEAHDSTSPLWARTTPESVLRKLYAGRP